MKWSWPRWSGATPVPSKPGTASAERPGCWGRLEGEGVGAGERSPAWMLLGSHHTHRGMGYSWTGPRSRAEMLQPSVEKAQGIREVTASGKMKSRGMSEIWGGKNSQGKQVCPCWEQRGPSEGCTEVWCCLNIPCTMGKGHSNIGHGAVAQCKGFQGGSRDGCFSLAVTVNNP